MTKKVIKVLAICVSLFLLFNLTACTQVQTTDTQEDDKHEHDVQVGTCSSCGEFQNKDLVTKIEDELTKADTELNLALGYMQNVYSYADAYSSIIESKDNINNLSEYLNNAVALCGNYEELNETKDAIESAIDKIPELPYNASQTEIERYLDELELFVLSLANAKIKILYVV